MAITGGCPGYQKHEEAKKDILQRGCWAEHEDKRSFILVENVSSNQVMYSVFSIDKSTNQVAEYRHKMVEETFKDHYSYDHSGEVWVWHDKSEFPWNKITKFEMVRSDSLPEVAKEVEQLPAIIEQELTTAAEKVAIDLEMRGKALTAGRKRQLMRNVKKKIEPILSRIQSAISKLDS